jgi:hypothetical protein
VIRKKKKTKQKEVSIFMPIGLTGAVTYLAKAALEANDFDVITNLAPGMIFGELSKTTQRGCFS